MPITRISHKGRTWPIEKFVQACLDGTCDFPAPIAATILENHREYNNHGTVSGSQLHKECDFSSLLERLPYTKEIGDMFWATYRGSNIHNTIEKCRDKPEFKNWVFEKRFFATLAPDDQIEKLDVPLLPSGEEDWDSFKKVSAKLIATGFIILSGQVDTFDKKNMVLEDWKTSRHVDENTSVKQSWQQQMNQYSLLLFLHDLPVKRIRITVMDATTPVVLEVPTPDLEIWAGAYLVPRVRYLASLQEIPVELIQAVSSGEVPAPPGFPAPRPNYLCNGKNDEQKIYCPFRGDGKCPAWRAPDLTAQLEESLRLVKSAKSKKERPTAGHGWI